METENAVAIGQRYKRRAAVKREYAWVMSYAHGSVSYQHPGGLASAPVEQFHRAYELAPKR